MELLNKNKIKKITIKSIASYNDKGIEIEPKKFNIVYGLNGSGKTTISKFLDNLEASEFSKCELKASKNKEILVYNEDYIDKVFRERSTQQGIFTVGSGNAEAQVKIEAANKRKTELNPTLTLDGKEIEKLDDLKKSVLSTNTKIKTLESTFKDDIFEYQRKYSRTDILNILSGFRQKEPFFNKVLSASTIEPYDNYEEQFTNISDKLKVICSSTSQTKEPFPVLNTSDLLEIELSEKWDKSIVGLENSYLSETIENLDNSGWISNGLQYLDKSENCPFCNQYIEEDIKDKIKEHFNDEFKKELLVITTLKDSYISQVKSLKEFISKYDLDTKLFIENAKYQQARGKLFENITSNINNIEVKVKDPSKSISLKNNKTEIDIILECVKAANIEVTQINTDIQNKASSLSRLQQHFFSIIKTKEDEKISEFKEEKKTLNDELKILNESILSLISELAEQDTIIKEAETHVKGVKDSINWINSQLQWMGMDSFSIIEHKDTSGIPSYKLSRNGSSEENIFKSLSEGEKTIISFLYFVKSNKGEIDGSMNCNNRVIVIDDPISSLSFNYIFEIASLIKSEYLKKDTPFNQIIILTHNLYFMQELLGIFKKKSRLKEAIFFRISKQPHTIIESIDKYDIQNPYESRWQILKDFKENKTPSVAVPNTIRHILENYLSFNKRGDSISDILSELSEEYNDAFFKSFHRYIDRESHSDITNISDTKDIDTDKFIFYLEKFFDKIGDKEHFDIMMQE